MLVRSYETIFITKPDFEQESVDKLHTRVLKAIEQQGGIELELVDWGKRRLAYPIDRQRKGNYFYFGFIAAPACIAEVHRLLGLSADVLRYQTVALSKLSPLTVFDMTAERARVQGLTPDPQDEQEEERRRDRRDRPRPRDRDRDRDRARDCGRDESRKAEAAAPPAAPAAAEAPAAPPAAEEVTA